MDAPEQLHLLETFASQTALALERAQPGRGGAGGRRCASRPSGCATRCSARSRTTCARRWPRSPARSARSSTTARGSTTATRRELLESVHEEAERLNRLVQNLLEMTRLESGALQLRTEWHPLEEVVGAALGRLRQARWAAGASRPACRPTCRWCAIDDVLIEQVLVNLLDNALKYTPAGSPIDIIATADRAERDRRGRRPRARPAARRGGQGLREVLSRRAGRAAAAPGSAWRSAAGSWRRTAGASGPRTCPGGGVAFLFTLPLGDAAPRRRARRCLSPSSSSSRTSRRSAASCAPRSTGQGYRLFEATTGADGAGRGRHAPARRGHPRPRPARHGRPRGDPAAARVERRCRSSCSRRAARSATRSRALDAGADDYVTQAVRRRRAAGAHPRRAAPRGRRRARGRARRRSRSASCRSICCAATSSSRGDEVQLTPIEYKLLATLVQHAGKVVTHQQLLREVWGPGSRRAVPLRARLHGPPAPQARGRARAPALPAHRAGRRLPAGGGVTPAGRDAPRIRSPVTVIQERVR